jgi:hypothetical protein
MTNNAITLYDKFGYKSIDNYIVYLQYTNATVTNEHRENILNKTYAAYRGNNFYVHKIESKQNKLSTLNSITSSYDG